MEYLFYVFQIILLVFYVLQCFLGYKMLRVSVAIAGFIAGAFIGSALTASLNLPSWVPVVTALALAIILALLAFKIYLAGVFLLSFFVTASVVWALDFPAGTAWNVVHAVVSVAAGILVGVIAVKFTRPVTILVTGIGGAINIVGNAVFISLVMSRIGLPNYVVTAILAILGILVQFLTTK